MSTKILYNFTIYFRHPNMFGACDLFRGTTTAVEQWDEAVTVLASTAKEAMEELEEGYSHMEIVKVEYPGGWPHFPLFPASTCSAGAVFVDAATGEHKLRVA